MNPTVEQTLLYYGPMLKQLEDVGCNTYVTGSALVPGLIPRDLDIVVECPSDFTRADLERIVKPWQFSDIDEKCGYEKDASATVPEDHNSDLGIYNVPALDFFLPVQLLLFVKGSRAAGDWRLSTSMLRDDPEAYRTREARVKMFREVRGQPT